MKTVVNPAGPRRGAYIHHALKIAFFLALANATLAEIKNPHWSAAVGQWGTLVVMLLAVTFAVLHTEYASECRRCHRVPVERLKRLHYRVWATYGRQAGFVIVIALVSVLILSPGILRESGPLAVWGNRDGDGQHFNWLNYVVVMAFYQAGVAYLSARLFNRLNGTGRQGPTFIGRYLRHSLARLVHHSHWFIVGLVLPLAALTILAPKRGIWDTVTLIGFVLVCALNQLDFRHGMAPCETCFTNFRTDAAQYAASKRWRFTVLHKFHFIVLGLLALLLVASFMPDPVHYSLSGILTLSLGGLTFLNRFHGAYLPWCPYCRGGGDDGGDQELAPEPTGGHGRPLPVA